MKNRSYKIMLFVTLLLSSCTKDFERINTDPNGANLGDLNMDFRIIGEPFRQIQQSIFGVNPSWVYQIQQNLMGDVYSGYMGAPGPFGNAGNNNTTYNLIDGWNVAMWGCAYGSYTSAPGISVMPVCNLIDERAGEEYKDFRGWMKLLKVYTMHRISDVYGPIIYTKYGVINPDGSIDYDSQKDAYYAFFKDLKEGIDILTPFAQAETGSSTKPFTRFDMVYGGSYKSWVKFGNTLRLRLAVRIAKIDPVKAKEEGEAALAHPGGLLTAGDVDDAMIDISPLEHPLNIFSSSWNDIRMGAPMESILKGLKDPRMEVYFKSSVEYPGEFKGVRNGIALPDKIYANFSMLAPLKNEMQMITAAEAWFLKAEAGLNNWTGAGDVKSNYEEGVKQSFIQRGIGAKATDYLADAVSKPAPYTDPKNANNNVAANDPYLSTITVHWEDGDTPARKLERIITQKWIAMFPDGQEAWTEFRRTGYPKLFPVVVNNSGGKIPTSLFIRRINFVETEYGTNQKGVQKAITLLGGADNGATRLWWDKP